MPDGRIHYANASSTLHSKSGGFLAFRDLVTGESVRLKNGTWVAVGVPRQEIALRQEEYLADPTQKPRVRPGEAPPK